MAFIPLNLRTIATAAEQHSPSVTPSTVRKAASSRSVTASSVTGLPTLQVKLVGDDPGIFTSHAVRGGKAKGKVKGAMPAE